MRLLICTDGTALAESAVGYGASLAWAAGAEVTLLGIYRRRASPEEEARLHAALARAQSLLPMHAEEKVRTGRAAQEIIAEARSGSYALIVVGSRGRRGLARLMFGSVASRLARYAPIPVLLVKGRGFEGVVRRVLVCTSGDVRGERAARWGGQIAGWLKAEVTVLHVMSQIALSPQANLDELFGSAEQAMTHGTREGRHLTREMEVLREQGGTVEIGVRPKLRRGLVVDEIVAEADEGNYYLVVIGAHEQPQVPAAGWAGLWEYVLDDVADQIISAVQRPVLVVKGK